MYLNDYNEGDEFETPGRTITEADIINFAGVTGDWGEMHTNREKAEKTRFDGRVAHGALIFSVSTGLIMRAGVINEEGLVAFYGIDGLRFLAPVHIGDTVEATARVVERIEKEETGVVTLDIQLTTIRSSLTSCAATGLTKTGEAT